MDQVIEECGWISKKLLAQANNELFLSDILEM
jgi:hypothetical protein